VLYKPKDAARATELLADLRRLGCSREIADLGTEVLAAVNIPGAVDADLARKIRETGLEEGTWFSQEGDDRHPQTEDGDRGPYSVLP
jgi:hypothetical protein